MPAKSFTRSLSLAVATFAVCLVCTLLFAWAQFSQAQSLISYAMAAPAGLERAWFAQAQVDPSRHHVRNWKLYKDNLLALSSSGAVHSFNAETGETLWVTQVGPLNQSSVGPTANEGHVALLSGATLHVLDRSTGKILWSRGVGGAPAAAPALSKDYVYVTFLNGRVEAYPLDGRIDDPWYSQSIGRIYHSATASGQVVTWPTQRGFLYVGRANDPHVLYRIETASPATAPPTEADPFLYVVSADGHLYCFNELTGREKWRYSMGFTAHSRAAAVGDRIYVASTEPMLHALNGTTGELLWTVPEIEQFVAQGLKNVYGLDKHGKLVFVDGETGKYVGTLPGDRYQAVFNEQSDRVILVNDRGLVQCLHEIDAVEPTYYEKKTAEETTTTETTPTDATVPAVEAAPADATTPFEEPAEDEEESPFQEEGGEDLGNPFSFGEE